MLKKEWYVVNITRASNLWLGNIGTHSAISVKFGFSAKFSDYFYAEHFALSQPTKSLKWNYYSLMLKIKGISEKESRFEMENLPNWNHIAKMLTFIENTFVQQIRRAPILANTQTQFKCWLYTLHRWKQWVLKTSLHCFKWYEFCDEKGRKSYLAPVYRFGNEIVTLNDFKWIFVIIWINNASADSEENEWKNVFFSFIFRKKSLCRVQWTIYCVILELRKT